MLYLPSDTLHGVEMLRRLTYMISYKSFSARVAEIVATGASHVRASFSLFYNLTAFAALSVFFGHLEMYCHLSRTLSLMFELVTVLTVINFAFITLECCPIDWTIAVGSLAGFIIRVAQIAIVLADPDDFILKEGWQWVKERTIDVERSIALVIWTDGHGEWISSSVDMVEQTVETKLMFAFAYCTGLLESVLSVAYLTSYVTILHFGHGNALFAAPDLLGQPFAITLHCYLISL